MEYLFGDIWDNILLSRGDQALLFVVGMVNSAGFLVEGSIVVLAIAVIAFPAVGWMVVQGA